MVEINLYQPGKLNIKASFPSEWNELLQREIEAIAKYLLTPFKIPETAKAGILLSILKSRTRLPLNFKEYLDPADIVLYGYPLLDFIFTENTLTNQPYQKIKLPGIFSPTVYGPASDFNGLTCGEFEDTEQFFFQFTESPSHEPLARIASVLFREKDVPYMRFDPQKGRHIAYDADKLFHKFLKLPPYMLYAIFIWYSGCRSMLKKIFVNAFEGEGTEEPDPMVFTKCIHAGAGSKNGTRDQVRMLNLKEYFFDMELEAIKAKELKKEYEKR